MTAPDATSSCVCVDRADRAHRLRVHAEGGLGPPRLSIPVESSTPISTPTSASTSTSTPTSTPMPTPTPKRYRTVLSAGDSFNGAFSLGLRDRFRAEGATFVSDVWVGVAVGTFQRDPRFARLIARTDPDLVILSLGANDVTSSDLDAAAESVRAIVKAIGPRDCYWVAPAMWRKDTGIIDVLEKNVAPCRFFASRGFKVERARDGWHPSVKGGADWAARFWEFFDAQRSSTSISPPQGTSTF